MREFLNDNGAVYGVAALCILEILIKGMLSHTYKRLLKAAEDMGHSEHRLMKSLRMKFETCYKLKIGVPNVEIFVEKYLRHYQLLGLRLKTWEVFCNQCMLLAMIGSLGFGIWAMILDLDPKIIFSSLFAGVLGNGIILLFDGMFAISGKRELLRIDMMDYLENVLKPRLENETFHSQMLEEYQQEYFDFDKEEEQPAKVVNLIPKEEEKMPEVSIDFTKEEEEIIREVIREYLG